MVDNQRQSTTNQNSSEGLGGMHYDTPAIRVGNEVRDGDEFILITRSNQSDGFKVWSSGDQQQTEQLYRQVASTFSGLETAST